MSRLRSIHLASLEELRAAAADWDDLWWRSETALPTARAEMLAQWVEQFKPRGQLPRAGRRRGKSLDRCAAAGFVPRRLADSGGRTALQSLGALRRIAAGPGGRCRRRARRAAGRRRRTPLAVAVAQRGRARSGRWQALLRACDRAGMPAAYHQRFRVGRVGIDRSWDIYRSGCRRIHRQGIARAAKRLACEGDVQYEMHSRLDAHRRRAVAPRGLRAWRTAAGRARPARRCSARRACSASMFVRPSNSPAGASWKRPPCVLTAACWPSSTASAPKACISPTRSATIPHWPLSVPANFSSTTSWSNSTTGGDVRALDFMGPLNQSLSRWRPETYGIGRVALAPPAAGGPRGHVRLQAVVATLASAASRRDKPLRRARCNTGRPGLRLGTGRDARIRNEQTTPTPGRFRA